MINPAPPAEPVVDEGPLKEEGRYHARIEMNDQVLEGYTDDIAGTVTALKPDRLNTKVSMAFRLAENMEGKVVTFIHMIPKARRLFSNTMSASILEKSVKMGLGDYHV